MWSKWARTPIDVEVRLLIKEYRQTFLASQKTSEQSDDQRHSLEIQFVVIEGIVTIAEDNGEIKNAMLE